VYKKPTVADGVRLAPCGIPIPPSPARSFTAKRLAEPMKGKAMKLNSTLRAWCAGMLAATMLAAAPAVFAQGMTSEQAAEMLKELKQIRELLERQPAGPAAAAPAPDDKVNVSFAGGGYSVGRSDAPLVLVEYTDYQCPFCQQFHNTSFPQIKANFIDTGKVRYISRDFPLEFHENAKRSAMAARCAAEQDAAKFWDMRHVLIVNADQLQPDKLAGYAAQVKVDSAKLKACVDSNKYAKDVDKDIQEGVAAGISGTPSFVIGRIENDKLVGVRMVGASPYPQFEAKINEMLDQKPAK
jgi:protein-disulfide isomerase